MIGSKLAHYEIVGLLGEGGMGQVYRARDTKLGREVALKVLPPDMAQDPDRRMRFDREARAVAALRHPHIVTIHSVEEDRGTVFLTMELVEGQTLSELIPNEGMTLERFFSVAAPLVDAVSNAHQKGITHRDLKPANVMIGTDKQLKVLDFGLAKHFESGSSELETTARSATAEGRIVGTVVYGSADESGVGIWNIGANGSGAQKITQLPSGEPEVSPDKTDYAPLAAYPRQLGTASR